MAAITVTNSERIGRQIARYVRACAIARGSYPSMRGLIEAQYSADADLFEPFIQKAVVAPMSVSGGELPAVPFEVDFATFTNAYSAIGKIPNFRRTPAGIRMLGETAPSSANWAGEGAPTPVSRMTIADLGMTPKVLHVAALMVVDKELLHVSSPAAEPLLATDIRTVVGNAIDVAFFDPANAGVTNVKPQSITWGTGQFTSTGASPAAIDSDVARVIETFDPTVFNHDGLVICMSPYLRLKLATLRTTNGDLAYSGLSNRLSPTMYGLQVVTTNALNHAGSPAVGNSIVVLSPENICIIDDNGVDVQWSDQTSLQMVDNPVNGPANMVSMFQTETAAIRLTRFINWKRLRPNAARVLTGIAI